MLTKKELKEYYKHADLWLPSHAAQRQYKLVDYNGNFVKITRRIGNVDALRKVLIRYVPTGMWYSSARFLNPEGVRGANPDGSTSVADHCILGWDLVFDVDGDYSLKGLEDARLRTLKIFKEAGRPPKYIVFTGLKGFQICYPQTVSLPESCKKRYSSLVAERKANVNIQTTLRKYVKKPDYQVTNNPYSIVRMPQTPRYNGFVATIISEKQLKMPIQHLITNIPTVGKRPEIPHTGEMTNNENVVHRLKTKPEGRTGLSPSDTITAVSSQSGNRNVVILKYDEFQNYEQDIQDLQKKFKIGPVVVLKRKKTVYAVSVAALDNSQCRKIYTQSRGINKSTYKRYAKTFLRSSQNTPFDKAYCIWSRLPNGNPVSKAHATLLGLHIRNVQMTNKTLDVRILK